ncbi:MAG TPA: potassium transporter [Alphaproteobacteria bacterium]|nr:potassium transporter [Alphaproteobacteria bacterium]
MLGLSVGIIAAFKRLNISPVLGYLLVGIIISYKKDYISINFEQTQYLAEFGVVFLLFAIGLELTFDRLKEMRKHVFGFGTLQVIISGVALCGLTYILTQNIILSFVAGFIFSLSSTAVVLQVLIDRGEEHTQQGRLALATLILQDLAFVPLLIMIPLLSNSEVNLFEAIGRSVLNAALVLVTIVIVGKRFLGPLYRLIASLKSQELFIATTLLILLGAAYVTQEYQLSLALGAFVAGLLIAETEYRAQVETDLKPFKGLLMGLFFISVGMSININNLLDNWAKILVLVTSIIFIKSAIIYFLARVFGFSKEVSIKSGLILSQASEFGFVLFAIAASGDIKIIPQELADSFIVVVSLSMAITPLLAVLGNYIARRIDLKNPVHYDVGDIVKEVSDLENHLIVVGFDKVGKTTCDLLKYQELNFVILDDDPRSVHYGRKNGYPIFFGVCNKVENLENLGIERAKIVVITSSNFEESDQLVKAIRAKYNDIEIVARAKDRLHARSLKHFGANHVIPEAFESSLLIGKMILSSIGISKEDAKDAIEQFRHKEYPESFLQKKGI